MKRMKKTYVSVTLALLLTVSPFLITSADSNTDSTAIASAAVSFNQALSIVRDAYPDLTLLSLALDDENGILVYQAELLNPVDSSVMEVAVDSKSGQISVQAADDNNQNEKEVQNGENVQYEDESDDNGNAEQSEAFDMSTVKVSFTQALSIVNTAYPDYTLFALELDSENGSLVYQAELLEPLNSSVLEVKIDPISGQVLSQTAGEDEQNGNAGETENELENETENDN